MNPIIYITLACIGGFAVLVFMYSMCAIASHADDRFEESMRLHDK